MGVDLRVRPELLKELRRRARGLVFVVGERGSGRTATLTAFADELSRREDPPVVVKYRFSGEPAARMGADLLDQLGAGPLAGRRLDEPGDLLAMLRIATRAGPVVCLFDDFSRADLVWWRLFLRDGAAELARMPLLMVATLDAGGSSLVRHEDLAGPLDSWFATTVRLEPVPAAELEAHAGRIAEPLRSDVINLVGGCASRVQDLWQELLDEGAIESEQGEWRWRWGDPADYPAYVREVFDRRIRECCATPEQRALAWAVVRMAAVEGVEFTPAAVAVALHRLGLSGCDDVDEVVEFIDEALGDSALIEMDEIAWCWRDRYAYRARFSHRGHAEALRRFGLGDEQRRWAAALVHALEEIYAGATDRIAPVLADVWTLAAEPERAGYAGNLTERRLRGLLRDEAAEPFDHLIHADHLLRRAAAEPWQALELTKSALRTAERSGSPPAITTALVAVARSLQSLGRFAEALPYAVRAGADWNARACRAACHVAIAENGDLPRAARISDELLAAAGSPEQRRTARSLRAQARAAELYGTGALTEAREALLAAPDASCLRLLRTIADRRGETTIAEELAHLMIVLAWDEPQRRARAEQDAEVARLSAALDDLGGFLRELHGQA
ncbi:ATP-binding protein [Actinoplanes sp. Pm04-4]|uniref:ATP-binding protein n=1 Tax=Paractinoplanes pyxinae TaxID=2997416 RepID=A0ABT4B705_9ACTN|nr:ATP-binding protein [Actinoplanes pyxinae]MCY1142292.1 ATP-binding protein [Actinoplanes pyxinae]